VQHPAPATRPGNPKIKTKQKGDKNDHFLIRRDFSDFAFFLFFENISIMTVSIYRLMDRYSGRTDVPSGGELDDGVFAAMKQE
jgi:hypothetical protein